jgi:hypothetical protein
VSLFAIFCGLLIIINVLLVFPALCINDQQLTVKDKVSCCIISACCGFFGIKKGAGKQENADNKDITDKELLELTGPLDSLYDEQSKKPTLI